MKRLYCYEGGISTLEYGNKYSHVTLYDMNDDAKAPVLLNASGGILKYLKELLLTDSEEKYLKGKFYYDGLFEIRYIIYEGYDENGEKALPSKIIAMPPDSIYKTFDYERDALIFGKEDYINESKPSSMSRVSYTAFRGYEIKISLI